jgi:acetylornithine deacetylase/succinyl-diaminopimelate desuccinylase-like protein
MGLSEEGILGARRDPATLAGYLELHVEQGPVLEQAGIDIGIVTGIVGTASFTVAFDGEARHAGTTPMGARRDAAVGADEDVFHAVNDAGLHQIGAGGIDLDDHVGTHSCTKRAGYAFFLSALD